MADVFLGIGDTVVPKQSLCLYEVYVLLRVIDYKQPNKHTSCCLVISIALGRNQVWGKGVWGGIACRGAALLLYTEWSGQV